MTCRVSKGTCALPQIQRNLLFESTCQKYWQFEADTAAEPVEVVGSSNGLVSLVACAVVINRLSRCSLHPHPRSPSQVEYLCRALRSKPRNDFLNVTWSRGTKNMIECSRFSHTKLMRFLNTKIKLNLNLASEKRTYGRVKWKSSIFIIT